jgi:predicted DNA-binding protein YlxM (UPF0122 family)
VTAVKISGARRKAAQKFWAPQQGHPHSHTPSKKSRPSPKFLLTFSGKWGIISNVVKLIYFTGGGRTVKNQTYRMTMLLDFYGEILTQRQREFFDLYYNEDLSLAEIAENYGISRQGVRDAIVRAETAMEELEDKTGLLKRFMRLREKIDAIEAAAAEIQKLNYRQYDNPELERLAGEIRTCAAALKE